MSKMASRYMAIIIIVGLLSGLSQPAFAATTGTVSGVGNVQDFITSITKVVVLITGGLAILMIAIGGLWYVTSSGSPKHLQRAKYTLLYAAIGLAIAIGSAVLGGIITALAGNAFGS